MKSKILLLPTPILALMYVSTQQFVSYNLILQDGTYGTYESLGRVNLNADAYRLLDLCIIPTNVRSAVTEPSKA